MRPFSAVSNGGVIDWRGSTVDLIRRGDSRLVEFFVVVVGGSRVVCAVGRLRTASEVGHLGSRRRRVLIGGSARAPRRCVRASGCT